MPWFNPTVILVALVLTATSASTGYIYGRSNGKAIVQQKWDKQIKEHAEAVAAYEAAAREQEAHMQAAVAALQKENRNARKTIADRDAALRERLRNRPDRDYSAKVPEHPAPAVGVSGAELARRDGEFLAGYAAATTEVYQALKQCESQYNTIQKLYSGELSEDSGKRDK